MLNDPFQPIAAQTRLRLIGSVSAEKRRLVGRQLIADTWVAIRAQFEGDELDTVFRFRAQVPNKKVRTKYPTMMIIRWPYQPKRDGMPRQADLRRMAVFEDALEIAVETPWLGIQIACLTGNGRRTWRYFVANPTSFLAAIRPLLKDHGPEPHLFRRVKDPEWAGLSELTPLLECGRDDG